MTDSQEADDDTIETPAESPSLASRIVPVLLGLAGLSIWLVRHTDTAMADWLARFVSFEGLPARTQGRLDDLLLVPAASIVVVFCRVSLGLRMLGPFRPILIGLAFYQTGALLGSLFLVTVMVIVVALRPRLENKWLPYFGRLSVLIAVVVLIEIVVLLIGKATESVDMQQVAIFPIIVLSLTADGYARAISADGLAPATMRAVTTLVIATLISLVGSMPAVAAFLIEHPELVLVEIGAILVISTRMKWKLLDRWTRSRDG